MKFTFLLTTIMLLSLATVFSTPTCQSTLSAFTSHASQKFTIKPDADGTPETHSALVDAAVAAQYWVCIAISHSTGKSGWSQGGSDSSALSNAKSKCGKTDCSIYSCQEQGCVGINYGVGVVVVSCASGYGSNDSNKATNKHQKQKPF
jgi:hypothetical protein